MRQPLQNFSANFFESGESRQNSKKRRRADPTSSHCSLSAAAKANRSEKKSAALAILAHIDTVGAGDMPEPFTPRERDGRLYGRGALDIKSGVAAMCAAAIAARDAGAIQKPLLIAAVVDEECDSIGTEALLKRYTADAAIVIEPTDLRLTIAHKGYAWFEILTHGRAAHGSLPSEGRDAIRMMGRVLNILDALDRKLASLTAHPLLGHGSLHASVIRGGQELSSYPAECRLQLERRMLPDESAGEIEVELRSLVAGLSARDPDFRATVRGLGSRPAYEISPDAPIVQLVSNAIRKTLGSDARRAVRRNGGMDGHSSSRRSRYSWNRFRPYRTRPPRKRGVRGARFRGSMQRDSPRSNPICLQPVASG